MNKYEKKSTKNSLLGAITETQQTKGDLKGSAIETGKDLLGIIVGGVVGAAMGRASLVVGAGVTGIGHYHKSRWATVLGVGMMASNGFQPKTEGMSGDGKTSAIEAAKQRMVAFKDTFSQKLFLDKIMKKKEETSQDKPVNGLEEGEYFTYPQLGAGEVDMSSLDEIERQVEQSAAAFKARNEQIKGILPSDEAMGDSLDPTDRNF